MKTVFSCGLGVQSSAIIALVEDSLLPVPDHIVFSDPGAESKATYEHLGWCQERAAKFGREIHVVKVGDIFSDAVQFAERLSDTTGLKRYASIPLFVLSNSGKQGMLPRQCTSEYKIEPIERYHRREVLGLKPRQHAPKEPVISVWIGISQNEEQRAKPPGRYRKDTVEIGTDLFGFPVTAEQSVWEPIRWQLNTYPLLGYSLTPDRAVVPYKPGGDLPECAGWDREDCLEYLAKRFPGKRIPRSACNFCPYRTNAEWRYMRDNEPEDWAQAVAFDDRIRTAYAVGQRGRGVLAGLPFVHRSMVPLDQVDLSVELNDRRGCGGLWSQEPDGLCGT